MKSFTVMLLGFLTAYTGCVRPLRTDAQHAPVGSALAVTLEVSCIDPAGSFGARGSGVIVGSRHVLTAAHVIDCLRDGVEGTVWGITGVLADGRRVEMTVDKIAKAADVARLVVFGTAEPFTAWAQFGPRPRLGATACVATGFPERLYHCGMVQKSDEADLPVMITLRVVPGNSGSAIYVRGQLVGIVTNMKQCGVGAECYGYGWHVESFRDVLDFPRAMPNIGSWEMPRP